MTAAFVEAPTSRDAEAAFTGVDLQGGRRRNDDRSRAPVLGAEAGGACGLWHVACGWAGAWDVPEGCGGASWP